jgi:hypothetical protein
MRASFPWPLSHLLSLILASYLGYLVSGLINGIRCCCFDQEKCLNNVDSTRVDLVPRDGEIMNVTIATRAKYARNRQMMCDVGNGEY